MDVFKLTPKILRELIGKLTRREADILTYLALGMSDGDIAARLGISQRTVRHNLRSARMSVGANSRIEMVALFVAEKFMDEKT